MGDPYEDGDKIGAAQWLAMRDAIRGNAVVSGLSVTVLSPLVVRVASGLIYYANETKVTKGTNTDLSVTAGDGTYNRIDILEGDDAGNVTYVKGTPAASPRPANLTPGSTLIAVIQVAINQTVLTNADIREMHFENVFLEHDHNPSGYGEVVDHAWLDNILPVDEHDTDANLDKHVSNALFKELHDILPWLSSTTPATVGKANAIGAATNMARSNHVHQALWGSGAGGASYVRVIPDDIPIGIGGPGRFTTSPIPIGAYQTHDVQSTPAWTNMGDSFQMPSFTVLTGCTRKYVLQAYMNIDTNIVKNMYARLVVWSGSAWVAVTGGQTTVISGKWSSFNGWYVAVSGEIAAAAIVGGSVYKIQMYADYGGRAGMQSAQLLIIDQVS